VSFHDVVVVVRLGIQSFCAEGTPEIRPFFVGCDEKRSNDTSVLLDKQLQCERVIEMSLGIDIEIVLAVLGRSDLPTIE